MLATGVSFEKVALVAFGRGLMTEGAAHVKLWTSWAQGARLFSVIFLGFHHRYRTLGF